MNDEREKLEAEVLKSSNNGIKEIEIEEVEKDENKIENEKQEAKTSVAVLEKKEKEEVIKEDKEFNEKYNKENNINKENQYQFKKNSIPKKSHKFTVLVVIIIIMIISIALLSTIFALINSNNESILGGISIKGTLVEGMTEDEAIKILNERFESEKQREIILKINGEEYSITPEQIEVQYNVEKAVEQAYSIGREGNIFQNNFEILKTMIEENNIDVEITYNEELLVKVLEGFNAKLPNAMLDNTYCVEEDELIITRGLDGIVVDVEDAKKVIIECINSGSNEVLELKTEFKECPEIDIDKIYSEVKSEPQDASYKKDPFEIIPHKYGIDFDIEEAKKVLEEEKDEYVIKLNLIEPETLTNEIGEEAFPDLLSSFSTKYDETNVSRTKNVKIAMSKLNGVVVMPGEVFSYNETLGKRTAEEGYEYANGFAGGKVVPMLAGGICQVSSTLYDAVLYANLNIVERHNHMFQATYVDPGKDATVVYGSLDFKFENTRNYPIMIKTQASGGLADIKIFGIKEEVEYEVEVITEVLSYTPYSVVYETDYSLSAGQERVSQWGLKGCKSITYRIVKLNGQEVSKEVLSTDTYSALNKIVKRGPTATTQKPTVDTSTIPEPETSVPESQNPVTTPEPEQETPNVEQETPVTEPEEETPEEPIIPEEPETPETPEEPEQSET